MRINEEVKNLRYIGPYFRMNKLSYKEINGQLFHLSKEAIRTLVLESKCGLVDSTKNYKKYHPLLILPHLPIFLHYYVYIERHLQTIFIVRTIMALMRNLSKRKFVQQLMHY